MGRFLTFKKLNIWRDVEQVLINAVTQCIDQKQGKHAGQKARPTGHAKNKVKSKAKKQGQKSM